MALRRRILHPNSSEVSPPYDDIYYCFLYHCPPPPEPPPESIPIEVSHPNHHLTNFLIAGCSLLGAAFLIFTAIFLTLHRRRRLRLTTPLPPSDGPPSPVADPIDHHVWHIRTVGLDAATIASISIVQFKPADGLIDGSDCAVCLTEFRDGEDLRLLPKCSHAFHIPCIDTWLRSRVSCPLCRAPIVASKDVPASESTGLELSLGDSSESVDGERTVAIGEEDGEEMIEIAIESCSQGSSSETRVPEDWQPVRRSVSMDASSLGALLLRGEPEQKKDDNFEEVTNIKKRGKQGSDLKMEIVKKGRTRMARSLSSSGRWFNLSRGKFTPTTVLPL
ncbi:E3 ubiquitin-protein ligase RING1-like [Dioscorea cayenensis subsp. rotundata]|uniref:RING-type E3 ubiquitin transferase n=1 Tax=Dioscorea cayennensis subsp. rotundata TaxID=55577 RepID=A0AB40CZJ8_DIOCR|nr:E3 ubiquitin-protein ligase RING1-like [Dioscorea cayenensis subsp. rotundata]